MAIHWHAVPLVLGAALLGGCVGMQTPATGVSLGRLAPDIAGSDAEGATFKLSDYRGKVVLLDFWHSR